MWYSVSMLWLRERNNVEGVKSGSSLNVLGNVDAAWSDIMEQATQFMAACYGQPASNSMLEVRISMWRARIGRPGSTTSPKRCSLPPTTEAFSENVKHAHLQTRIWTNALELDPLNLEPTNYGCIKEVNTKSLLQTTVPANAPNDILKLIWCTSGMPSKSSRCACNIAKLACAICCTWHASIETRTAMDMDGED